MLLITRFTYDQCDVFQVEFGEYLSFFCVMYVVTLAEYDPTL
jgi:hypothetical protein